MGSDRAQLSKMALAARQAMDKTRLHVVADRGYYNSPELKACDDAGIATYVPRPMTSNAKAEGRFNKADFIYIARDDEYECPAGQRAIYRFTREATRSGPSTLREAAIDHLSRLVKAKQCG